MSIAVNTDLYAAAGARRRFISNLKSVAGTGVRVLYMPSYGEGATAVDGAVSTRVWTHANTPVGRLSKLGNGVALSFNGTSDLLTTPDAADLTFIEPAPMSIFAVVNVTDTAAARVIVAKDDNAGAAREWSFSVGATDLLTLATFDQSTGIGASKATDAAITQGAWSSMSVSYSGIGGATAADGMTVYQNAVAPAQTSTNNASYVAMEDLGQGGKIGASQATPAAFFAGSMALVMVWAGNGSTGQQFQLHQLSKRFFGI